jgi:hypothetical protein
MIDQLVLVNLLLVRQIVYNDPLIATILYPPMRDAFE